jgi:BMFP domain-containing protein YqiC
MDGLKMITKDKVAVENVFSKIRQLFEHYGGQGEQQRKQAYESLKVEFEAKMHQAMQQQLGPNASAKIDVEIQPEFHQEWHRLLTQLDSQYFNLLDEYKQNLLNTS